MKPFHGISSDRHHGGQGKPFFTKGAHTGSHANIKTHAEEEPQRHRRFHRGELKGLVLHLLTQGPAHGYELIKAIGDQVGGDYQPSPGVIYPTLNALEAAALIRAEGEDGGQEGRKAYAITEAGKAHLAAHAEQLSVLLQRLEQKALKQRARNNPQINGAMEQLKTALRNKFANSELTESSVAAIAQLLERAAQDIEQC